MFGFAMSRKNKIRTTNPNLKAGPESRPRKPAQKARPDKPHLKADHKIRP